MIVKFLVIEKGIKLSMNYLLISIILGGFGQVLLKKGMEIIGPVDLSFLSLGKVVWSLISNPFIVGGIFTYGISMLLWLTALSKVELSYAYPFVSLGYIIMIFASWLIFHENITLLRLSGCLVILLGVIIISRT